MTGATNPGGRTLRLRQGERAAILVVGDLIAAATGAAVALFLWGQLDYLGPTLDFVRDRAQWFVLLPLLWPIFLVSMYDLRRAADWRQTVRGVLLSAGVAAAAYLAIYFLQAGSIARRAILYYLALLVILTLAWRWLYIRVFTAPTFMRRVLIVGAGQAGQTLLEVFDNLWPKPFRVVGLVDDAADKAGHEILGAPVLGDSSQLEHLIEREAVSDLIVAIQGPMKGETFQVLLDAQERGIEVTRMPVIYEELLGRVPIHHLESEWVLKSLVDEVRVSSAYLASKRVVDILGGLVGVIGTVLVFPFVSLAIVLDTGRPVLFRQARIGQGGRIYELVKFRTMRPDAESAGEAIWAVEDDPRATRVGQFLRRIYVDEFPQFWSVLKGDMSLIGPRPERPELVEQLQAEIPFYRARLLAKPGISGWAQVNFSKGASVEGSAEKLEYDLYYIKHRSLLLDLWIVMRTVGSMLGFRGV